MNRGRHRKKELNQDQKIKKLLKIIEKNNNAYRTFVGLYKDNKPIFETTSILSFHEEKEIKRWFEYLRYAPADTITIDLLSFKL